MTSLSEKIAILANPAPVVLDPEDDVNIETVAKAEKHLDNIEALFTSSELRSKAAALLEDCDPVYVGKKISRKSLDGMFHDDAKDDSCSRDNSDSDDEESDEMDEDDEIEEDSSLKEFKQMLDGKIDSDEESEQDEGSVESEDSENFRTSDDMVDKFSNFAVTNEKKKGCSVKAQQEIWNRLCESRIKQQKELLICNKLPQGDIWSICKKKAGDQMHNDLAQDTLKQLLNKCINLQEIILQNISQMDEHRDNKGNEKLSDEEIPSDTEEEMEVEQKEESQKHKKKVINRKLKCEEYNEELSKRFKTLIPYKNSVIQKWDEKAKLSSGKITQKSFSAFESSALKQIEQTLQDEDRLIKRTQLKRSLYRVLGKPDVSENKTEENLKTNESKSKQDMLLRDYDTEIFDDDDFYRQLLKEVIESKSIGIDPAVLRKQMEIQAVRNKLKKKVDTKASKGRKIRYDVHPKLVGFMRKTETSTISDDAREDLLKSMFGRYITK